MPSQPVVFQQSSMRDYVTLDEDYVDEFKFDMRGYEDKEDEEDDDEAEHDYEVRRGPGQWRMVSYHW